MNKLLQTTLISAILSMSVMAGEMTGALPKIIESGATVYVNKDISIGGMHPTTIDNYGSIDTEITSEPYPKLMGSDTTINNHVGRSVKEETDTTNADAIKTSNPVTDVTLDKVYKIVDEGGGYVNENFQKENVEIVEVYDAEIKASDLAAYTNQDILYLGAEGPDRTVRIRGDQGVMGDDTNKISCNIGSQEADNAYNLEIVEHVDIQGDISNYKSGSITIKKLEEGKSTILSFRNNSPKELYIPVSVKSGNLIFYGNANIYSNIDVSNDGSIEFSERNTLKKGAVLRIGTVE